MRRSYQLFIEVGRPLSIQVGRLGTLLLPAGRYVYTGSAMRNLEARIARHLGSKKRLRWHIDNLLAEPASRVVRVRHSGLQECASNHRASGTVLVEGFGASDCQGGCGSDLEYRKRVTKVTKAV